MKDLSYETNGDGTVPYESATMIQQLETLPEGRVGHFDTTHIGLVQYRTFRNEITCGQR